MEDAYKVCGQAVKYVRWANPRICPENSFAKFHGPKFCEINAIASAAPVRYLRDSTLGSANRKLVIFESVIVQPGLSKSQLGDRVGPLLAAADGFLYEFGRFTKLRVIGSG